MVFNPAKAGFDFVWSRSGQLRRTEIEVGVPYASIAASKSYVTEIGPVRLVPLHRDFDFFSPHGSRCGSSQRWKLIAGGS
jgi:hypothetical protein